MQPGSSSLRTHRRLMDHVPSHCETSERRRRAKLAEVFIHWGQGPTSDTDAEAGMLRLESGTELRLHCALCDGRALHNR